MSFDSAPQPQTQPLSQEAHIALLDTQIEEAHLSYQEELVVKLQGEREKLLATQIPVAGQSESQTKSESDNDSDAKYSVKNSQSVVVPAETTGVEAQVVYGEAVIPLDQELKAVTSKSIPTQEQQEQIDEHKRFLDAIKTKAQNGEGFSLRELDRFYFKENVSQATSTSFLSILELRTQALEAKRAQSPDYVERNLPARDLEYIFKCNAAEIARDASVAAGLIRNNTLKIFVGEPTPELVTSLQNNPQALQNAVFFRAFPGNAFPVRGMTFEEMKNIARVL